MDALNNRPQGVDGQFVEDHVELVELGPPPATTGLILLRAETANGQSKDQIIFYFWPLEISKNILRNQKNTGLIRLIALKTRGQLFEINNVFT